MIIIIIVCRLCKLVSNYRCKCQYSRQLKSKYKPALVTVLALVTDNACSSSKYILWCFLTASSVSCN